MLRASVVLGTTTIRMATEDIDYGGYLWEARLTQPFNIDRIFDWNNKTSGVKRSLSLQINNRDLYFNTLQESYGLLNSTFTLYYDEGNSVTKKFMGNVSSVDSFGLDIQITITENFSLFLDQPVPDLQMAYDYYSDNGINESWNAVPLVVGEVDMLKTMWVDRVNHRFVVCAGEINKIKKVYFDKTAMYDSSISLNGYRAKPEDHEIKVRIFVGSGWESAKEVVVDSFGSHTSVLPGICYIEFYDGTTGDPIEPVMTDGTVPQIYVDLEGASESSAMIRNPVTFLYKLLTNPVTSQTDTNLTGGANGWGLGVPTARIDTVSFNAAIAYCDIVGYKIDGALTSRKNANEWVDEILKTCAGQLYEEEGLFCIKLDKAKEYVSANFDEAGLAGYETIIEGGWKEPPLDQQINRLRLFYDYDYKTGKWNKKPDYNQESPAGDAFLRNETHALRIAKWNTATLELPLVKDDQAALRLGQLYFKRDLLQLKEITFKTEKYIPENLDADDLITITSSRFGWSVKPFIIKQITKGEKETTITAKEYDDNAYIYENSISPVTNVRPNYSPYAIPEKPEMSSITRTSTILADGTDQIKLAFTFIKPPLNVDQILVYRKLDGCPDTDFSFMAATQSNCLEFIWDNQATGNYNFRAMSLSPYGVYSGREIVAGDKHYYGQPNAESYITLTGDSTAPAMPSINTYAIQHGVVLGLSISPSTPADFSHFCIQRREIAGACCCNAVVIATRYAAVTYVDTDANCALDYKCFQYSAAAIDRTGNSSGFGTWSSTAQPLQVQTRDITVGAITSDKITSDQIIGKDFRTACNVGDGCGVSGIRFDGNAFEAYCGDIKTICIDATTGDVTIVGGINATTGSVGGWCVNTQCIYTNNIALDSTGSIHGNYTAGCCGWCIGATGDADFNEINLRSSDCCNTTSIEILNGSINFLTCIESTGYLMIGENLNPTYGDIYARLQPMTVSLSNIPTLTYLEDYVGCYVAAGISQYGMTGDEPAIFSVAVDVNCGDVCSGFESEFNADSIMMNYCNPIAFCGIATSQVDPFSNIITNHYIADGLDVSNTAILGHCLPAILGFGTEFSPMPNIVLLSIYGDTCLSFLALPMEGISGVSYSCISGTNSYCIFSAMTADHDGFLSMIECSTETNTGNHTFNAGNESINQSSTLTDLVNYTVENNQYVINNTSISFSYSCVDECNTTSLAYCGSLCLLSDAFYMSSDVNICITSGDEIYINATNSTIITSPMVCFCATDVITNANICTTECMIAAAFCTTSARELKCCNTDISVLCDINKLCIQAWKKIGMDSWGIGPYAEDVYNHLAMGDCHYIPILDGVALKGVQELSECIDTLKDCINSFESRIKALEMN